MNRKIVSKILPLLIIAILIQMNFYGMNFGAPLDLPSERSNQPYNSFKNYIWGGVGNQENEKYGWNITYIESLNGDNYKDLVVGNPWYDENTVTDIGAVHIFFGKANTGFDNISISEADITIVGDAIGDNFGWDVADAGDTNNDGYNDLIVGAPGAKNGRGRAFIFYGGSFQSGSYNAIDISDRILDSEKVGVTENGNYGSSVLGVGDFNNDDYDDVIVGAPGSDQVIITFGYKNKMTIKPNLWDDNLSTPGIVDFSKGVNNYVNETYKDNNTWGLDGEDDGWDWIDSFADLDNLYGQTSPAPYDHANVYAPWEPDSPDADGLTFANQSALEVMIGRNHTHLNPYINSSSWDAGASAAWGIEFNLTPEMSTKILSNSTFKLAFDYKFVDTNKLFQNTNNTRVLCMIKSRIWNRSDSKIYLGDYEVGNEKYVIYRPGDPWGTPAWGPIYDHFEADISDYIDHAGTYYWDFGCYLDRYIFYEDDGIAAFFDNITMEINNDRVVVIEGMKNSGFGSAISALGDINGDGYPDAMIGAPNLDGGYVVLLHGKERFKSIEPISSANIILTGKNPGDKFGYSIASTGDVDNDGINDVLIGAPGGNYAHLYYGSSLNIPSLVPDLSENNEESNTPQIEFNSGIKTSGNTPGLVGADDGWDIWNGVYGYESSESPGSSVTYNGANSIDTDQVAIDNELIIAIGGDLGGGTTQGAKPDSGAYGTKFTVSQGMIDTIENGGEAIISFDWKFNNIGLDQDDTIWIKSFMRNSSGNLELGWNLDENTVDNDNKDDTNELYWVETPESTSDVFIQDCSECFSTAGSYYFDVGAKVRDFYWESGLWEDGVFHFDNIYLRFNPHPYVKFSGPEQSGFGFSVGFGDKLNIDDNDDIIIGAPYYDSPNGNDSGAVFGFISDPTSNKQWLAENAEFVTYGEDVDDYLGWTLLGTESLDSDDFSEIITSAINYDSPEDNAGKIYIFSITKIPRIRLLYPLGGELLSGSVVINATVTDPDENIDTVNGVVFYYKNSDQILWQLLGNDPTPDTKNNFYEYLWDTTTLPDGSNYYIRSTVQDQELNFGENISLAVTIDNPHPPTITIQNPKVGEIVQHTLEIRASVKDSTLDLIGGGINTDLGVHFYFSSDKTNWELIGVDKKGTQGLFTEGLDTRPYQDGEYWIKVNGTDLDGFEFEEYINFTIDNPSRAPKLTLLSPLDKAELSGTVLVSASAYDFDGDINSSGVTFYVASDTNPNLWLEIGNAQTPVKNDTGADIYSFNWDTTTLVDQWYILKGFVNDSDGLTNVTDISKFAVHNKENTPPYIEITSPQGGKILETTQIITARVRDLENNIDQNGVSFYYSENKEDWNYLGVQPNPASDDKEIYNYLWATDKVEDGFYWINVTVSDTTGLMSWATSDETVTIHNSNKNPPKVRIVAPELGEYLNDTCTFKAYAFDMENNIDLNGVTFSISSNGKDFTIISNVVKPKENNIYELGWDSTTISDGKYWLKAESFDNDGLKGQAISDYFFIHNQQSNPPNVFYLGPHSGEVNGIIKLTASVFDLENNLDDDGVRFYYSIDKVSWNLIGNDPTGKFSVNETLFEILWDTTTVADNIYWLRAYAKDKTNLDGFDLSTDKIIVHNNLDNPPIIRFIEPKGSLPLESRTPIKVEVIDFENDVEKVTFYYSKDNETWKVVGTNVNQIEDIYATIWSTEDLTNGFYYIKVKAIDVLGNSNEITAGPFEYNLGTDKDDKKGTGDNLMFNLILLIIIIVVIVLVIFAVFKKQKKREKELIKEVAAEAKLSQTLEGEIVPGPTEEPQTSSEDSYQSYIPASETPETIGSIKEEEPYEADVETIESYKSEMDSWKAEGFEVTRLEEQYFADENMFAKIFPVFASNVSKLRSISERLDSIDSTGHETEVDSLRTKLFNPDKAMLVESELKDLEVKLGLKPAQLPASTTASGDAQEMPGTTPELPSIDEMLPQLLPVDTTSQTTQEPEQLSETEIPPDVELPPEIDTPPDTQQPIEPTTSDIQESEKTSEATDGTNPKEKND